MSFENEVKEKLQNNKLYADALYILSGTNFHRYADADGMELDEICEEILLEDYDWHSGASKICILFDNFVLKTSIVGTAHYNEELLSYDNYNEYNGDYSKLEYEVYQRAVKENVSQFFAETFRVANYVYAQRRSEDEISSIMFTDNNSTAENFVKDYCKALDIERFPNFFECDYELVKCFLDNYSDLEIVQLYEFLDKYDINDLYESNIGVYNNKPIIFDFSGYNTCTEEILSKNSQE